MRMTPNELERILGLRWITDENNNRVAEWYLTTQTEGIVVNFRTLDPSKCKAILNTVLNKLGLEVKGAENE